MKQQLGFKWKARG